MTQVYAGSHSQGHSGPGLAFVAAAPAVAAHPGPEPPGARPARSGLHCCHLRRRCVSRAGVAQCPTGPAGAPSRRIPGGWPGPAFVAAAPAVAAHPGPEPPVARPARPERRRGASRAAGQAFIAAAPAVAAHPGPEQHGARLARPGLRRRRPRRRGSSRAGAARGPAGPARPSSSLSPQSALRRTRSRPGPGRPCPAFVVAAPAAGVAEHLGLPGARPARPFATLAPAPALSRAGSSTCCGALAAAGALWAGGGRPGGQAAGGGAKRHPGIKLISFQYDKCRAEGRGNVRQARPRHGSSGPIPLAQLRGEGAAGSRGSLTQSGGERREAKQAIGRHAKRDVVVPARLAQLT
jgi:hypothetical protein